MLVEIESHDVGVVDRPSCGHSIDQVEALQAPADGQHRTGEDDRAEGRKHNLGDYRRLLRPIDDRCLEDRAGDSLQVGQKDDHVQAGMLPQQHHQHRQHGKLLAFENPDDVVRIGGDHADKGGVDAHWAEDAVPQKGYDHRADGDGKEDHELEELGTLHPLAVQEVREQDAQGNLPQDADEHDLDVVPEGAMKHGVAEDVHIVPKSDEAGHAEASPLRKG
ncbi:hypothetical protein SDC9_97726 [bioreactor metagenome]|uniref:Uncharacterized protein n=1 Tax=bioreactor metagenome TaxID=1076179 RepID=A0A645ACU5_9ZZZZ